MQGQSPQAVQILNGSDKNSIGIRDADKGEDRAKKLFKLPGTLPPKNEVINCINVREFLRAYYAINVESFLQENRDLDHHEYYEKLSTNAHVGAQTLETECIRQYVQSLTGDDVARIIDIINENL